MIKYILHIALVIISFSAVAQKKNPAPLKRNWSDLRKNVRYQPSEKYKGPKHDTYGSPAAMSQGQSGTGTSGSSGSAPMKSYSGTPLSQRQLQSGKNIPTNPGKNGGGTIERDPNIVPSEPIEFPEADYDPPSASSNMSWNMGTGEFWKTLGIILLILLAVYIIYLIVKNYQPKEKSIPFEPLLEDMNPDAISKTELELRLDEALRQENYKECVRIYFLFGMKELMSRRMVFWKKEKTNLHYIIEMHGKQGFDSFENIVSYYDIVWYGDYAIDQTAYSSMQPKLERAYKNLEALK